MGFEKSYSRKITAKIGGILWSIFSFSCSFLSDFYYASTRLPICKENIQKYTKIKWIHMWLEMNMKKGPRLDFFDFVVIVLVCIIWKAWMYSLI